MNSLHICCFAEIGLKSRAFSYTDTILGMKKNHEENFATVNMKKNQQCCSLGFPFSTFKENNEKQEHLPG
jgi:hypothetical protein